ncbi:unnamed protein product [Protopolystoma xenopodis]|uniref:Uncharacterized protein n=1 Tax=Protopolystoma xenopodis TaxID=117903 RepID=A0A3S5CLJ9_9PLAT|nr:unnamed protein product [Protopolystoma xenopodis]
MRPSSDDVHRMMDENSASFHSKQGITSRLGQPERRIKATRPQYNEIYPSSSGANEAGMPMPALKLGLSTDHVERVETDSATSESRMKSTLRLRLDSVRRCGVRSARSSETTFCLALGLAVGSGLADAETHSFAVRQSLAGRMASPDSVNSSSLLCSPTPDTCIRSTPFGCPDWSDIRFGDRSHFN